MLDRTGIDWLLCMFDFEIYFDNSEPEPATTSSPAFPMAIAACYIFSKEQCDHYVRNFDEVRRTEGFEVFHMTDFMANPCQTKPFCDWDQAKRDRVYYRIANLINTRVRTGFAFGVPCESFDLHAPQHMKDILGKRHFTFAVRCALYLVQQWYARYGKGKAVQYVFDRMGKGKGEIMTIFDGMKEFPEVAESMGVQLNDPDGFTFQNKEFFKPLQTADILAWNMRRHLQDFISRGKPDTPPPIRPYFQFLRKAPIRVGFFRDVQIERGAAEMLEYEEREGKPAFKATRRQLKQWKAAHAAK